MPDHETVPPLAPFRADMERLTKITICTRPFRAVGPRIEAERLGDKLIVHNYGHGGSGWSLSWGSGQIALDLALAGRAPSQTDIAVIGCGALGLTAAILAQRAGAKSVTIYAKDLPSETRSSNATGSWTPFSRIALQSAATPAFADQWEQMTRASWAIYQNYLGTSGNPIEFTDRYYLSDDHPDISEQKYIDADPIGFVNYGSRVADLGPRAQDFPAGTHPFPTQWVRRRSELMFSLTPLIRQLTDDFQRHGGKIVRREFNSPSEFATLAQPVILHCTGYAARKLFGDDSLTPVRGQISWLPVQPEANYGLYVGNLGVLSRRDGIVIQFNGKGDDAGWNDDREAPDPAEAEAGVRMIQDLYDRMKHA